MEEESNKESKESDAKTTELSTCKLKQFLTSGILPTIRIFPQVECIAYGTHKQMGHYLQKFVS